MLTWLTSDLADFSLPYSAWTKIPALGSQQEFSCQDESVANNLKQKTGAFFPSFISVGARLFVAVCWYGDPAAESSTLPFCEGRGTEGFLLKPSKMNDSAPLLLYSGISNWHKWLRRCYLSDMKWRVLFLFLF